MIARQTSRLVDGVSVLGAFLALSALDLPLQGLEAAPLWLGAIVLALAISHVVQKETGGLLRRLPRPRLRSPRLRVPRRRPAPATAPVVAPGPLTA
ncbi:MAG: hypothetical protein ACF8R7_02900 [Phycisphaerales bacterium JB039]